MITFAFMRKKRYRTTLLGLVFLVIMGLAALIEGSYENYGKSTGSQLGLIREQTFPLPEISGMYLFPGTGTHNKVYLIGDTMASLGTGTWDGQNLTQTGITDFSQAILKKWGLCHSLKVRGCLEYIEMITSQWEGVTSDRTGRAFLLHEQLGTIFIFNPDTNHIDGLINLESFTMDENRRRYRSTVNKENAMGEGLLLLKNGHILVIKERFEPTVIEFGPAGSAPEGYRPDLWVGSDFEFPVGSARISLLPLKIWNIHEKFKSCDLSELSTDPMGGLFVLSQQCGWIAEINPLDPASPQISFKNLWSIPSKIKKAEAFFIPDEQHIIVAEDKKSVKKANIYVLKKPDSSPASEDNRVASD